MNIKFIMVMIVLTINIFSPSYASDSEEREEVYRRHLSKKENFETFVKDLKVLTEKGVVSLNFELSVEMQESFEKKGECKKIQDGSDCIKYLTNLNKSMMDKNIVLCLNELHLGDNLFRILWYLYEEGEDGCGSFLFSLSFPYSKQNMEKFLLENNVLKK